MYVKDHNTSFMSYRLHRIRLFKGFQLSCPTPMLCGHWDGPCWVPSVWLPFSSVLPEDLRSFLLPGCVLQFCFLIIIAVSRVVGDVFCPLQCTPPAAVRLLESEGRHITKFTFLGLLPSTADVILVPRHGSVHLGIWDFFEVYSSRSTVFRLNRLTSVWMLILTTQWRSCVQGSE